VRDVARAQPGPGRAAFVARVSAAIAARGRVPLVVAGPDVLQVVAHAAGADLVAVAAAELHDPATMRHAALRAGLAGARLAVDRLEELVEPSDRERFARAAAAWPTRLLVLADKPASARALRHVPHLLLEVPALTALERVEQWARRAPDAAPEERDAAARRFELSAGQIAAASALAADHSLSPAAAARHVSRRGLDELAQPLKGTQGWDDLVLPRDDLAVLRSIAARLRHRETVLDSWGFAGLAPPGGGLKSLFVGEPGTGKTLAAQVIANDLGLEAYRVDLAQIVSKYIGETEKNLERVFDAAGASNAVLFFDEADALFGKRSPVGDAHDRYANLEVAYLLQRIETYAGAVILATNLRQNLDQAFLRRLDFAVDFPMPKAEDRLRLWRRHLPAAAPVADDVDLERLAAHRLSGGSIRNSAVAAAFGAAEDGSAITMRHLELAVRLEHRKLGRLPPAADPSNGA
ncbi:MAG TPA: ATP-binding protein, partial [Solirubrobacteraceae bacterium]|nr:ATP-binding protein [Solirubrobacteraceae bacterium]